MNHSPIVTIASKYNRNSFTYDYCNFHSQLTVPKEDAPPPPRNAHTSTEHNTSVHQEVLTVHNGKCANT